MIRLLIAGMLALAIAGCESKESSPASGSGNASKPVIGVIPKGTTHVFWQSVHAGAKRAAAEDGAEIRWQGPQNETERGAQIRIVDDMMLQGVDAIVLAPIDADALVDSIQMVHKKMPVVIFDSGAATDQYTAFVATDNFKGGQLAGEEMLKLLGDAGGDIAIIRVLAGSASTTQREEGFKSVIARNPKVKIVAEPYGESTRDVSQRVTADVLQAHPNNLVGIFGPNESSTFGALGALEDAKKSGRIKFVGFDSSPELVAALDSGKIDALVLQDPVKMGYLSVKAAIAKIRGSEVAKDQPIEPTLITQATKDQPAMRELLTPNLGKESP